MSSKTEADTPPFWVDEQITPTFRSQSVSRLNRLVSIWIMVMMWLVLIGIIVIIWTSISKLLASVISLTLLISICLGLLQYRRKKSSVDQTTTVQIRARELTGADLMGSAVHVAGHPNLEQNQPVVLALVQDNLVIYPYESAVILDQINTGNIEKILTVVYDEDRIPHVDVIDPTAQALQFEIITQGKSWRCLFNRFRQVRAIDWFNAIQKIKVREY